VGISGIWGFRDFEDFGDFGDLSRKIQENSTHSHGKFPENPGKLMTKSCKLM
jgi:hypothetical protein